MWRLDGQQHQRDDRKGNEQQDTRTKSEPHEIHDRFVGLDHRRFAIHRVDHEQVHPDGWRDQAHFDNDQNEDAEPDRCPLNVHAI